jgi:hypothetical protein
MMSESQLSMLAQRLVNPRSKTAGRLVTVSTSGQLSAWFSVVKQAQRFNWISREESCNALSEILSLRRASRGRTSIVISPLQSGS